MNSLKELLSNAGWMIHDLVSGDQIDNEEEERLLDVYEKAKAEFIVLKHIETIAGDVNQWLIQSGLGGTAHQRSLEAALKGNREEIRP